MAWKVPHRKPFFFILLAGRAPIGILKEGKKTELAKKHMFRGITYTNDINNNNNINMWRDMEAFTYILIYTNTIRNVVLVVLAIAWAFWLEKNSSTYIYHMKYRKISIAIYKTATLADKEEKGDVENDTKTTMTTVN